jgi:hypothetical protein
MAYVKLRALSGHGLPKQQRKDPPRRVPIEEKGRMSQCRIVIHSPFRTIYTSSR